VAVTGLAGLSVPGLDIMRAYKRAWWPKDILAGLVLTAVLVPVGMGYAEAAGLPAITGLYATITPLQFDLTERRLTSEWNKRPWSF